MAVRTSGINLRELAQGLTGLLDLLDQKDRLHAEVAELTAARDRALSEFNQAQESAKSEHDALAASVAKLKQQQANTIKTHEKRIEDLMAQEGPLKDRLAALRRQIEADATEAGRQYDTAKAKFDQDMQALVKQREALKAEVQDFRGQLGALHAALGKVATPR